MKKLITISLPLFVFFSTFNLSAQRSYKELINDNSVNFYDVCATAEAYFEGVDKDAKGSGWKGYQRWKMANESKYYPSGDRSNEDPYFVKKQFEQFMLESAPAEEKVLFSEGWEEVGPSYIDSITGHYAAGLGRIETFYVSPIDENIMYVGSRSGGFWGSTDGGVTWSGGSTDFLFASGVNTIGVSPTNADSILINVRNSGNSTTHGIYRSTDAGANWVETNFNPIVLGKGGLGSNFRINRVVYHPTVTDLIFVCASDGLYRSDDNLATWLKVTTGSISDIEFHPTNSDIIYIYDYYYWGTNKNKVLRSTDNGLTFSGSAEIVGNDDNTSVQLDVSPECEDCVYFASWNGIWKSFDSGLTFNFVSDPDQGSQGFAVSDIDSSKIIFGYLDAYASDDGGVSFDKVTWWSLGSAEHGPGDFQTKYAASTQYIHADLREAECINGVFYVSTDGHFAKSLDNGATWEHLTNGIGIRENYSLGISQSNHYRTMVGSQDNGTSIKHKDGWMEFWGADGMEAIIHPLNSDWMIGSNQYGGRRRTYNGGISQGGASPGTHSSGWIAPLVYDPNNHMTVYHFGENVHKSEDFGSNYIITGTPSFTGQIQEAAIAENNSDIIIVTRQEHIERSMDGGVTFTDIQGSLPDYSITDIAFDPNDDNTFVVTYNRYQDDGSKVFVTHDMGDTWTNITENLNDMPIRGAVIDHTNESYIYLAAEIGVYVKAMDATDWELYNTDLPNCMIYELEINNASNSLRAATWGRGVWEYTLKDRSTYPAILTTEITDQPTYETPKESVEQFVTSKIHYDGEITATYVKWSTDSPTFENTIEMENVSDSTWVSITEIPNYPVGTKMYFKVYTVGDATDTTETYKFMYTVKPFEYCDATGSAGTGSDYLNFVELEGISNSSGQDYYGDFTALTTTLYLDSTYTLQAGLNWHFAADAVGAWIDFNNNALFEEDEFINMSEIDASHQSFGTFTIPNTAVKEAVRMRVRNVWSAGMNPCGTIAGEVEDYTILLSCSNSFSEMDVDVCDEYVSPSGLYTWNETGVYLDTISNSNGCDSVITINLAIGATTADVIADACESYVSPSGDFTWTSSGIYTDVLTNAEGCDSTITVNLSILEPTTSTTDVSSCTAFTSPSGDFIWEESGTFTDVITNAEGCDSVMTINLTIVDVNVAVTAGDYELSANETGVSYQWLNCDDSWLEIAGATSQNFEPTENGSYAVVITDGDGCTDTSACYDIVALSIPNESANAMVIYPNPTTGSFTIKLNSEVGEANVKVFDLAGKLVYNADHTNSSEIAILLDVADGIYYVELTTVQNEKNILKLVVE